MAIYRPTWAGVSQKAFASNLRALRAFIGRSVQILAVLKADAYGHGAVLLAKAAVQNGATHIGISSLEEGIALREAGVKAPLLILGGVYPLQNFDVALKFNLIPTVASQEAAEALRKAAFRRNKKAAFHLKVDTGMGRIGVSVEHAKRVLEWIKNQKEIRLAGVYSHLAAAGSDAEFTKAQLAHFNDVKQHVSALRFQGVLFHIANSTALLHDKSTHYHMVRPGLSLYGAAPTGSSPPVTLLPVLSWQTKIIFLKKVSAGTSISYDRTYRAKNDREIATLPVGYADGVPRRVSNKGFVLVKGARCPIVGRVTMDHIMIDVTGLSAKVGDDVMLVGRQGKETISVWDWAGWAETIPYEIFCGLSKRVPRVPV